jgi:hypothetical protein
MAKPRTPLRCRGSGYAVTAAVLRRRLRGLRRACHRGKHRIDRPCRADAPATAFATGASYRGRRIRKCAGTRAFRPVNRRGPAQPVTLSVLTPGTRCCKRSASIGFPRRCRSVPPKCSGRGRIRLGACVLAEYGGKGPQMRALFEVLQHEGELSTRLPPAAIPGVLASGEPVSASLARARSPGRVVADGTGRRHLEESRQSNLPNGRIR